MTKHTPPALYGLVCYGCGYSAAPKTDADYSCPECGEPLSIEVAARVSPLEHFTTKPDSMWYYAPLLPVDPHQAVSLGEGATPLLNAPRLAEELSAGAVLLKNESVNPTGSFKDRQVSVGITRARELGLDTVAVVSSGNVACAASAYAARAGMKSILMMHGHAGGAKAQQATAYGGQAIRVDTPSARAVFDLCREACKRFNWYHLSTAGMYEPFNVEGAKTLAYEIYQQTGGELPDWVVAPVGGGGLLGGIWRGFCDLVRLGLADRAPRLAGVQAAGCAPLAEAIRSGASFLETLEHPWPNPETIAGGIADDILFDGHTVLPAIRETDGVALAVDDAAILRGLQRLAETEGILVEPTCAVVVEALKQLPDVDNESRICVILTGNGVKDLAAISPHLPEAAHIPPTEEALFDTVERRQHEHSG